MSVGTMMRRVLLGVKVALPPNPHLHRLVVLTPNSAMLRKMRLRLLGSRHLPRLVKINGHPRLNARADWERLMWMCVVRSVIMRDISTPLEVVM